MDAEAASTEAGTMLAATKNPCPITVQEPATAAEAQAADDIALAQRGDQLAFERIYRQRVRSVSRYISAMVRETALAEDVTSQTFLLAWRDLPKLRDPERFDAWLFRIAHNQAMTEVGRRRQTVALDDAPEIADLGRFGSPQRELQIACDVDELRVAITHLPETQREVLILRYFNDLSAAEIARQIGKNEQSVWALTYRALQNLKKALRNAD